MAGRDMRPVYSYHTFLYPFLWDNKGNVSIEDFDKWFCPNKDDVDVAGWHPDDIIYKDENTGKTSLRNAQELVNHRDDLHEEYRAFQYFNEAARKALFRADGNIVRNYVLQFDNTKNKEKEQNKVKYLYRLGCCTKKLGVYNIINTYDLEINAIRLKVFNTGVAILIFELLYPIPAGGKKQAHEDIRIINEYGRRLYPEFITENRQIFLCPDRTEIIKITDLNVETQIAADYFWERFSPVFKTNKIDYVKNPIYLPEIIKGLLTWKNTGLAVASNYDEADYHSSECKVLYIEPAIDDRMFVCCCIIDADYTDSFIINAEHSYQNPKWKFMIDWDKGQELYAVTNMDQSTDSSCQNRVMLDQYFDEQLYLRWIEYGTIHAVTNHSMVCLTGDLQDTRDSVVYPFLTLYTQMCAFVLAQRASLISFDAKITDAVSDAQTQGASMDKKCLNKLLELSERFAIFQGEILLAEITPQIQGIELYEKLQKMLFIDKLERNIQQQLNNLFEIAESIQARLQRKHDEAMKQLQENQEEQAKKFDNALAKFSAVFTAVSIISIFSAFADFYGFFGNFGTFSKDSLLKVSVCGVLAVAGAAGFIIWKLMKKWMGNDK